MKIISYLSFIVGVFLFAGQLNASAYDLNNIYQADNIPPSSESYYGNMREIVYLNFLTHIKRLILKSNIASINFLNRIYSRSSNYVRLLSTLIRNIIFMVKQVYYGPRDTVLAANARLNQLNIEVNEFNRNIRDSIIKKDNLIDVSGKIAMTAAGTYLLKKCLDHYFFARRYKYINKHKIQANNKSSDIENGKDKDLDRVKGKKKILLNIIKNDPKTLINKDLIN